MKVAIIGSRGLSMDIGHYLPYDTTLLISGGASGIDACAAAYARKRGLPILIFPPDYDRYGRGAPLVRNQAIIEAADLVVALWDGRSRGTQQAVRYARGLGVPVQLHTFPPIPVEPRADV